MEKFKKEGSIDWIITIVPLMIIGVISVVLLCFPGASQNVLEHMRQFFVNDLGFFYILLGLGMILLALGIAFSKYGKIRLGKLEKPKYGNFSWGAMIFTSTMAADILYWSLIEWSYYYQAKPFGMENMTAVQRQDFASAFPLFHWGPIPWAFYILPACAYGYMMFVRHRNKQTLSEACRPILKGHTDKGLGRCIDIFAIVGLLAGTATTFSLTTPLLSQAVGRIFGIETNELTSVLLLVVIGLVFVGAVLKGMKAISYIANACVVVFGILLAIFILAGPKIYMIETAITSIGTVVDEFFHMATWMDPLRSSGSGGSGFPQDFTIFYWAYWIAWFVATPFFIAKISEGRTIKQTILGGLSCGLLGTYTSFCVFGNFGLHLQTNGKKDLASMVAGGEEPSKVILTIFDQLPLVTVSLVVLVVAMVLFYASTFDAITLVVASYSEKKKKADQEPRKKLRAFWSLVFLLLPVALLFSGSTLAGLQTISIVAAFPLGIIMIMVVVSFIKELKKG